MTGGVDRSERRRRRREGLLIFFVAAAFLVLAVLQTRLPEFTNSASLAGNIIFFLLINLNVILLVLFLFLVARNLVKLIVEQRQRILGARLRARLVIAFVTLTLFPTLLLFVVAEGFLSEAINNWFSTRVVTAVEGALGVAHRYYQRVGDDALHHAAQIAGEVRRRDLLNPDRRDLLQAFVENERLRLNVDAVQVADYDGPLALAHVDSLQERGLRVAGSDAELAYVQGMDFARTQKVADGDLVRGGVPVRAIDGSVVAVVVVDYVVPRAVSQAARDTVHAYDEYRQLAVLKQPIVNSYTLTLLLITLVVLLAAIWFGFTFAKGFTVPIQRLGEGMSEVAQGNLGYRAEAGGDEEFAPLFASFNTMAGELQTTHSKLDERRSYIENVLRNITAGVLSIDELGNVAALNPAAASMLTLDPDQVRGRPWREALAQDQLSPLRELLDEVTAGGRERIERQVKLAAGPRALTAWVTAIHLEDETGAARGAILFLEDVSYLLRVERMEAWREVARRIAHEIKNPLTPIQLSAQRLQKRYGGELGPENGALLQECTNTIVGQVEQLKRLVNEFSTFARLPAVEVAPNDLAAVVEDALVLFREGHGDVEFDLESEEELPAVEIDPEAIQRVVVNLLDNAVAACRDVEQPRVEVKILQDREVGVVRLEVADNGSGISPEARGRIFEPYFSTKSDGTGLGLAIVAAIVAEHRAYIRVFENQPAGTRFVIDFPRRSQSPLAAGLGA
jgi:two-component system, NtrC family, nitrogen regulation sensor histidine kinase NtrY